MRKLSRKPSKELKNYDNLYDSISKIRTESLAKVDVNKPVAPAAATGATEETPETSDKKDECEESNKAEENNDDVEMNDEEPSTETAATKDQPEAKEPVVVLD